MLPNNDASNIIQIKEVAYPSKTYKIDKTAGRIMGYVDGQEAVHQAIRKILDTERYAHEIYGDNYGREFDALIGQDEDYVASVLEDILSEAVLMDDRVNSVTDFTLCSGEDLDSVVPSLTANTIYGDTTL